LPEQEKVMNAVNGLAKVMVCGVVAVVLTAASSVALLKSNSIVHFPTDMPTVVILAKADTGVLRLAQAE
jgi:hypothetical protein